MKLRTLAAMVCLLPLGATSCSGDDSGGTPTDAAPDGTTHPEGGGATDAGGAKDQQSPPQDVVTPTEAGAETGPQPDGGTTTPNEASVDSGTPDVAPDTTGGGGGDAAVDSGGGGGADTGPDVLPTPPNEAAQLDVGEIAEVVQKVDAELLAVLPSAQGIVNLFVDDDALKASEDVWENADNVYRALKKFLLNHSDCRTTDMPILQSGADNVTWDPDNCKANDLQIAGHMEALVTTGPTATIKLGTSQQPVSVNGYKLTGTIVVKLGQPTEFHLAAAGLGSVGFRGTGTVSAPDAAHVAGAVTGSGTITGAASDAGADGGAVTPGKNGWDCTQTGSTEYTVANLTRTLDACYPHDGKLTVKRSFDCQKAGVLVTNQPVESTTTLDWTSTGYTVNVVNANESDGGTTADAGTTVVSTMPWTCPSFQATNSDAGELQPDAAGEDAGDGAAEQ